MPRTFPMSLDWIGAGGRDTAGEGEPRRKNHFTISIPLPSSLNLGTDSQRSLELTIHSINFPKHVIEVIEYKRVNSIVYVPNSGKVLPFEAVFTDYHAPDIGVLARWSKLIHDPVTGGVAENRDSFAVQSILYLLLPDGRATKSWKLLNFWPSTVNLGGGDMNSSEVNRVTCTFQCDSFETGAI